MNLRVLQKLTKQVHKSATMERLCLKNTAWSRCNGNIRHLFFWWMFLAVEKTLSDGAVEAGMAKYFRARVATCGYAVWCAAHHIRGSPFKWSISGSLRYLLNKMNSHTHMYIIFLNCQRVIGLKLKKDTYHTLTSQTHTHTHTIPSTHTFSIRH